MKQNTGISILLVVLTLVIAAIVPIVNASASNGFRSQGKFVFTNGTDDTSDDVVFDAEDFKRLADVCR